MSWESRDVFFSVCALSALIHSLRDPALHSQYGSIVHTIVYVLKLLGPRSVIYLRQLIPDYFRCLENTRDARVSWVYLYAFFRKKRVFWFNKNNYKLKIF